MSVYGNFIAGEWRKGSQASANVNPSDTNDIIGEHAAGTRAAVEDAVAAARQALKGWARQTEQTRADILFRVADELLDTAFGCRPASSRARRSWRSISRPTSNPA